MEEAVNFKLIYSSDRDAGEYHHRLTKVMNDSPKSGIQYVYFGSSPTSYPWSNIQGMLRKTHGKVFNFLKKNGWTPKKKYEVVNRNGTWIIVRELPIKENTMNRLDILLEYGCLEEGLVVKPLGLVGKTLFVDVNGRKYGYNASPSSKKNIGELEKSFLGMLKHSVGKALAFLKKNTTLASGSLRGLAKTDPARLASSRDVERIIKGEDPRVVLSEAAFKKGQKVKFIKSDNSTHPFEDYRKDGKRLPKITSYLGKEGVIIDQFSRQVFIVKFDDGQLGDFLVWELEAV